MKNQEFDYLVQRLNPVLQKLERKRKELLRKGRAEGAIWAAIVFFLIFVILAKGGVQPVFSLSVAGIVALIVFLCCVSKKSSLLSSYYKKEVIDEVVQNICPGASYVPGQGISEAAFRNSGLFQSPDRYHAEDQISGCLGKTTFTCSEVHAEELRTRSTKNGVQHYWVTIFRGFLFMADFHKDFSGKTTVMKNSLFKMKWGESRVKMENPDFEKVFDVFSTGQVEARYLITPSMMERLLKLNDSFKNGVTISFRDSYIIVAIPNSRNCFEASIWTSMTDLSILKADFEIIYSLLQIVDELNLNTRIWTKE